MEGGNFFQCAQFGDASFRSIQQHVNAHEQNNVDEEFQLRRQLYENTANLSLDDAPASSEHEAPDEEIEDIRKVMRKGQEMMKDEIITYTALRDELDEVSEQQRRIHEEISCIRNSLLVLDELRTNTDVSCEDQLATISHAVREMDEKTSAHFSTALESISQKYEVSKRRMMQFRDVYRVAKNNEESACPICMTHQVESFLAPCGHTYCNKCLLDIRARCYICRQPFSGVHKLYFS